MTMRARKAQTDTLRVLRTEEDYDAAIAEIERLSDANPQPGTPEFDRFEVLALLIEAYEDEHYPMGEASTPQAMVDFLLEARQLSRADLVPLMGGKSRVSEFFSGKRRLSLPQLDRLRMFFGVSADLLL